MMRATAMDAARDAAGDSRAQELELTTDDTGSRAALPTGGGSMVSLERAS